MSPEQAQAKRGLVGVGSEVYSLGAILYELLTGRPPFRAESAVETLRQVIETEPLSPRLLNASVPLDLETICLKCLQKEPHKRYLTAQQLADDLQRYLLGKPILARPISRPARVWRWCRRNQLVANLVATVAASLFVGITLTSYFAVKASRRAIAEAEQRDRAERGERQARGALAKNTKLNRSVTDSRTKLKQLNESHEARQRELYGTLITLARTEWLAENVKLADEYLEQCPASLRRQDWHDLKRLFRPEATNLSGQRCVAISADGQLLASATADHSVLVWRLADDKLVYTLKGHVDDVTSVAFSRDGTLLASGGRDRRVCLWNLNHGSLLRSFREHSAEVTNVAFCPTKRMLAAASDVRPRMGKRTGEVILFDLELMKKERSLEGFANVEFDPSGQFIAVATEGPVRPDGNSTVIQVRRLSHLGVPDSEPYVTIPVRATAMAFSADGERLAVTNDKSIEVWNLRQQAREQTLPVGFDIHTLVFSPNTKRVACGGRNAYSESVSTDFSVVVFNLTTGAKERILPWHDHTVTDVAFGIDSGKLAVATFGSLKLWDATPPADPTEAILATKRARNVGHGDWPEWGGSGANINTPDGKNIPIDWDVGERIETGRWTRSSDNEQYTRNAKPAAFVSFVPSGSRNIKWAVPLGSLTYGNPVVANTRVFVGTNNRGGYLKRYPPNVDLGVLLCFDEQTGRFLWQHSNEKLPDRDADYNSIGVCSTPVVDGDRLWYVSNRGCVVCLDTKGYHDGEDDGRKAGWGRLFDLKPTGNQFEEETALLNTGKLSQAMHDAFAERDMPLPDDVDVKPGHKPNTWALRADISGIDRQLQLRIERAEHHLRDKSPRLSGFLQLGVDDRNEADVVWEFDMIGKLGVSPHLMSNCSITTADGMLFVCTSNGTNPRGDRIPAPEAPSFLAMDRVTGKVIWSDNSPGANILDAQWASPAYGVLGGQPQVIFPGGDGWVYSFDPQGDGRGQSKLLWKFDCNAKESEWRRGGRGSRKNIIAFPTIYDGLVYIAVGGSPEHGGGAGHLWCIDPTKRIDGGDVSSELAINREGRVISHRRIQAVDVEQGEQAIANPDSVVRWHYEYEDRNGDGEIDFEEAMHRALGAPAIKDDILYIADYEGLIHCLDAKYGKVFWTYDTFAECWSSPLIVENHVFVCDADGDVNVFRHSSDPIVAKRNRPEVDMGDINMGDSVNMTPIVANNVLYIATRSALYAIKKE